MISPVTGHHVVHKVDPTHAQVVVLDHGGDRDL